MNGSVSTGASTPCTHTHTHTHARNARTRLAIVRGWQAVLGSPLDFERLVTCPDATVTTADPSAGPRPNQRTKEIGGLYTVAATGATPAATSPGRGVLLSRHLMHASPLDVGRLGPDSRRQGGPQNFHQNPPA